MGVALGVGVGRAAARVGVGVGRGVAIGVGDGRGVAVTRGVGVALGVGVTRGVGLGVGRGVDVGRGVGVPGLRSKLSAPGRVMTRGGSPLWASAGTADDASRTGSRHRKWRDERKDSEWETGGSMWPGP